MSILPVSVIIPVHNGAQLILDALESLVRQTFTNYEVIVVDDGSTDDLQSSLRHFPEARCIRQRHGGVAAARNRGIRESSGDYLAFLDCDDIWLPDKLKLQLEEIESQAVPGIVGCNVQNVLIEPTAKPDWYADFGVTYTGFIPSALLIHNGVFETVGSFNESLQVCEDTDWLIRVQGAGIAMGAVSQVLLERRFHSSNQCNQRELVQESMRSLLRDNL